MLRALTWAVDIGGDWLCFCEMFRGGVCVFIFYFFSRDVSFIAMECGVVGFK